ncbi:MAG: hypothetical protein V3T53_06560 [Phycisphaerales bacterium]
MSSCQEQCVDLDGDRLVGFSDVLAVLAALGQRRRKTRSDGVACIIALVFRAFDDYEKYVTRYRAAKRELFLA